MGNVCGAEKFSGGRSKASDACGVKYVWRSGWREESEVRERVGKEGICVMLSVTWMSVELASGEFRLTRDSVMGSSSRSGSGWVCFRTIGRRRL